MSGPRVSPGGQIQSAPRGVFWHPFEHKPFWCLHSAKSQPSPSSAPLGQSLTPSQTDVKLTHLSVILGHFHCPWGHFNGGFVQACCKPSSEPSPHWSIPSQTYALKIHLLFSHL